MYVPVGTRTGMRTCSQIAGGREGGGGGAMVEDSPPPAIFPLKLNIFEPLKEGVGFLAGPLCW
jgi:hypothetical protein